MLTSAAISCWWINSAGQTLVAPSDAAVPSLAATPGQPAGVLLQVLWALTAVVLAGQLMTRVFSYLGQPPIIGEVVAGILLGPSLLGAELSSSILTPVAAPYLGVIAQLGVILYMFLVGLELDWSVLKHRAHAMIAISHASIVVPFLLGNTLALLLYPRLSNSDVPFTSFTLFLGVAMSITAFPVLARILTDQQMSRTELGMIAIGCAASDDVTAWCLLAFVVGIAQAQGGVGLWVVAGALAYIALMFALVRPLAERLARQWGDEPLGRTGVAMVFLALLFSTLATEAIGVHAIFGAFLLGAVIPHDSQTGRSLVRHLEHVVTVLMLPAFFALTGMRTRIDLVVGVENWLICGLIILVATAGKFGATLVAARLVGLRPERPTSL